MTATRGDCQVCGHNFALNSTGVLRAHTSGCIGHKSRCAGGGYPPAAAPIPRPAVASAPRPPSPARELPPEVVTCTHSWSGWTRLPTTTLDFRRCQWCQHLELQQRQPCALCRAADARAYEIPDYGTAYVCASCLQAAA